MKKLTSYKIFLKNLKKTVDIIELIVYNIIKQRKEVKKWIEANNLE